jgi:chemotaxis signal transduction protein
MNQVSEIIEKRFWNPLPIIKNGILGLINRFGNVFPIFYFDSLVYHGLLYPENTEKYSTIIVIQFHKKKFAFLAENVNKIHGIYQHEIHPLPKFEQKRYKNSVTGIAVLPSQNILILNLENIK